MSKKSQKVRIGMLKSVPKKWDVEGNWSIFEDQFQKHRADGLDVFITPECFLDGYAVTEETWTIPKFRKVAQDVAESSFIRRARQLARKAKTHLLFGFSEILNNRFMNAAVLIGRDGAVLGTYYKTHLLNQDRRFARGDDLPVFETDFGSVGIAICADRRWPETLRTLRLKGARICLMPTYGMWHQKNEWWMQTRSYENQMFVCFTHPNVALITNPNGDVEAKLQSSDPDVLIHEIDIEMARDDNHLENRRPELYEVIGDAGHESAQAEYRAPAVRKGREKGV